MKKVFILPIVVVIIFVSIPFRTSNHNEIAKPVNTTLSVQPYNLKTFNVPISLHFSSVSASGKFSVSLSNEGNTPV